MLERRQRPGARGAASGRNRLDDRAWVGIRQLDAGDAIHSKHAPPIRYTGAVRRVRISSVSVERRKAIFNYYGRDEWFGQI
ncbi:MAG: hypothetical protein CBARDCOR_0354 [uncultured Caballeronia sp.]|nr:MAG: hypothetical protein CBARDCOR_0354 [uncultured Caballeronia sp.]